MYLPTHWSYLFQEMIQAGFKLRKTGGWILKWPSLTAITSVLVFTDSQITYLNFLAINIDCFHREINTNCISSFLDKVTTSESMYDTSFSYSTVSDEDNFKEEIITVILESVWMVVGQAGRHFRTSFHQSVIKMELTVWVTITHS